MAIIKDKNFEATKIALEILSSPKQYSKDEVVSDIEVIVHYGGRKYYYQTRVLIETIFNLYRDIYHLEFLQEENCTYEQDLFYNFLKIKDYYMLELWLDSHFLVTLTQDVKEFKQFAESIKKEYDMYCPADYKKDMWEDKDYGDINK